MGMEIKAHLARLLDALNQVAPPDAPPLATRSTAPRIPRVYLDRGLGGVAALFPSPAMTVFTNQVRTEFELGTQQADISRTSEQHSTPGTRRRQAVRTWSGFLVGFPLSTLPKIDLEMFCTRCIAPPRGLGCLSLRLETLRWRFPCPLSHFQERGPTTNTESHLHFLTHTSYVRKPYC